MSNGEEATSVLVALRRIIRFLRLADRQAEASHGLSAAQLFVLHSLAETPAESLGELALRTLTDQSSVSMVVSRLEAKRLLVRVVSRDDRRRIGIKLTAAGKRVVAASGADTPQPKMIAAIEAMSLARRRELVRALEGLVSAIGADKIEPLMLFEGEDDVSRRGRRRSRK
jgi:DNA-binding MarR family transcriptional regulator